MEFFKYQIFEELHRALFFSLHGVLHKARFIKAYGVLKIIKFIKPSIMPFSFFYNGALNYKKEKKITLWREGLKELMI